MKIALFHNVSNGGVKRAIYEQAKELIKRGHVVDAFIPTADQEWFLPLDEVVSMKKSYAVKNIIPYINIKGFRIIYYYFTPWAQKRVQKRIAEDINKGQYDIAFVHQVVPTHGPFILRYLDIPAIYYLQDPLLRGLEYKLIEKQDNDSLNNLAHTLKESINTFYAKTILLPIDRSNTKHAKRILVNSYYSHESVLRAYGLNSYVCYLGVDTEKFKPLIDISKENIILSVGRLHILKGFRFILHSLAKVKQNIKKFKYVIIGDVNYVQEHRILTELARKNNVDLEIKINISEAELIQYYNKARLVVNASYAEPFGLVSLEAMSCGTPVVGVKEGGLREVIEHEKTGLLIDRDEQEFGEAVMYLFNNPRLCKEMGANARDVAIQKWSWAKATDRLLEHFNQVLEK